ncbi:MAG: TetR/AcrR family transcriptional regulator [Lachnospiraceae bacterium]|nr:TetR/AcrR family transcriptional regulator [Lachnospiraceae bacterium]MDE6184496.1 TetR/AcrR family transcriptional regulator [Lachnospiraceae bacterium]MDE7287744.1 TetR/AcrR family transcriptional regulator [Lachnospiraceae bacterium]
MNEKFFDLKKEKQDRMINAALKVFAMNGYEHASTDDIVKEAGISKGLLFHYFISKLGLYSFIYDYSVRYILLELSTGVSKEETDYFTLLMQIKQSHLQVMKNYPYMLQFISKSREEDVSEALVETEEKRNVLPGQYEEIMERADLSRFKKEADVKKLTKVIEYTSDGLMTEHFRNASFQPEIYYKEIAQYLEMMKKLCY